MELECEVADCPALTPIPIAQESAVTILNLLSGDSPWEKA
jgi:hypothetical protein